MTKGEETRLRNLRAKAKHQKLTAVEKAHLKRLSKTMKSDRLNQAAFRVARQTKSLVHETESLAHRSHQLAEKTHHNVHDTEDALHKAEDKLHEVKATARKTD